MSDEKVPAHPAWEHILQIGRAGGDKSRFIVVGRHGVETRAAELHKVMPNSYHFLDRSEIELRGRPGVDYTEVYLGLRVWYSAEHGGLYLPFPTAKAKGRRRHGEGEAEAGG